MEIGRKLRNLRNANDLTLEELASRCELTKGFLSQVERDLTSPSISTLEDILEALGSSLSEFFARERDEQIVFGEEDFFVDEQEDHTTEWIVPNAQKNEMEPIRMTLPAGCKSPLIQSHMGEEFGYVLKGRIEICIEDQKPVPVRTGETFYVSGNRSHQLSNSSKKEAVVLWVSCPPVF